MPANLDAFRGQLPYASELFGVYQPLIGWRGRQGQQRVVRETRVVTEALINEMLLDSRFDRAVEAKVGPYGPDVDPLPFRLPDILQTDVAAKVQQQAADFVRDNGRAPTAAEWPELTEKQEIGRPRVVAPEARYVRGLNLVTVPRASVPSSELRSGRWHALEGSDLAIGPAKPNGTGSQVVRESIVAGTLQYLAKQYPHTLDALLLRQPALWDRIRHYADPLDSFDPQTQQAVLSPIGVLQLYRQYFFELDSFLGPAVGHIWLSPGSSLELYEVHSRKRLEERQTEQLLDVTTRAERTSTDEDELSTAVSEQNSRNTNLAVSASAGVNFGVVSASASASFGLQQTHQTSQQAAHRHTRQQSEKLASDIRKSFKTSFRTSVEAQDLSSRRCTLVNNTDTLANYELRRKMRQVTVQVQHIGTQLCWQVYLDEPGAQLGVASLVHATASGDLSGGVQPPDAPPTLLPLETEIAVDFPFQPLESGQNPSDDVYTNTILADLFSPDQALFAYNGNRRIRADRKVVATPPQVGYELAEVRQIQVDRVEAKHDIPTVDAIFLLNEVPTRDTFTIRVRSVNFRKQPAIKFTLNLIWRPSEAQRLRVKEEFNAKVTEYKQERSIAAHREYVEAVRDRIKSASAVASRPAEDLREEERTVVYRGLIGQLTGVTQENPDTDLHVTGELIRSLFDVDKMLYFVAPEWWLPRERQSQQRVRPPRDADDPELARAQVVGPSDTVGWGQDRGAARRRNYQITEESQPAPMGASLGWTLQLDADAHRNAFLNTPWVRAVLPIRPGREAAALNWLQRMHIEGVEGLDARYFGPEGHTVGEALRNIATELAEENNNQAVIQATEKVFETGFDPLERGFNAAERFEPFDQWIEVLPTDQIVAVDYQVPRP